VEKKNLLLKLDGIVATAKESQHRYFQAICTYYRNRFSCCRLLCKLGALYNREFSRLAMDRLLLRAYEKYMVTPSNLQYELFLILFVMLDIVAVQLRAITI
jgi:hypothetical protein